MSNLDKVELEITKQFSNLSKLINVIETKNYEIVELKDWENLEIQKVEIGPSEYHKYILEKYNKYMVLDRSVTYMYWHYLNGDIPIQRNYVVAVLASQFGTNADQFKFSLNDMYYLKYGKALKQEKRNPEISHREVNEICEKLFYLYAEMNRAIMNEEEKVVQKKMSNRILEKYSFLMDSEELEIYSSGI